MFEIRSDRTARGPVKLTAERQKYFELISKGVSNNRACAIVGVGERTGRASGHAVSPRTFSGRGQAVCGRFPVFNESAAFLRLAFRFVSQSCLTTTNVSVT
jgi:hypothetical protein